jgi:Rha family phage regulatory protein
MENLVVVQDNKVVTTSLKVAEVFEKEHYNVIRDIKNLECSRKFHALNFEFMQRSIKIGNGATRQEPCYNITRDGFVFLAMGFTGKKASQFKSIIK